MEEPGFRQFSIHRTLERVRGEPRLLLSGGLAFLRGWWYRLKFFLLAQRFRAGRRLRVYGPLILSGPGRVEFGDDVLIISDAIKPVCIRTLHRDAVVRLGDNAGLNGASIQCVSSVRIDAWSNIADAYITDSAAHNLHRRRRQETIMDAPMAPVHIEENVWISVSVVVLHGVTIGRNSVIGACSLVNKDIPSNVFAAGNPLKILRSIDE